MTNIKNTHNVLQVTAALEEGGVERGTVEMAAFTGTKSFGSFVASAGGRMEADLQKSGAHHIKLPLNRRDPFSIIYCGLKLVPYIKKHNIALVHARSRAPAWAALLACKLTKTPFVTTFHGTHKIQNSFKKLYNSSMVRGLRVIAISGFIKEHVIKNYGVDSENIDIAHRGILPENFNPNRFAEENLQSKKESLGIAGKFILTLPGRLTRWKGQVEFINALAILKEDNSWHALIVGGHGKKIAYKHELENLIKGHGLESRITLTGSQSEVAEYYALSDAVISASNEPEAFGRVAIEAGAMGKCIVATSHGGSLETVKDGITGYLTPPHDAESMAKILRRVMEDKANLQNIGDKAYEWVHNTFTVESMCHSEWAAYMKILEKK